MELRPTIGLEIHIELNTRSKIFCSCPNDPEEKQANSNICPVCLGHPGTLPVINEEAVRKVIKTGLALDCQIPENSKFDRKNYFYPDLPKGYQISQYDAPLCIGGYLELPDSNENIQAKKSQLPITNFQANLKSQSPKLKKIRIRRIHLEEDTGRLLHPEGADYSLVDFNRAGIPLMELVTEPDITSAKEARKFAEELQLILRYLGVSNANMEKGQMRVEVNLSLSANQQLGTKVEIKNLNSFRIVEKALDYEIERQKEILESGQKIIQETRGWVDKKEITVSQREKEEAHDYRYFPEPDLPPLNLGKADFLAEIRAEIPELPQQRRERFKKEYFLSDKEIETFVFYKELGEYFEKVISELRNWVKAIEFKTELSDKEVPRLIKIASNYILTDLQGLLRGASVADEKFLITPENFAEFVALIYEGKISSKIAKQVLAEMFKAGADPSHIIEEKGLEQITDRAEIEKVVRDIISQNQKAIEDFKKGKGGALQFLIGQVMKQTKGKANPQIVTNLLKKLIS
jgi:aspartyl-tRNA(Asn)/glutamyl-tRNA(Gln) amidotransferase subunit B